MADLQEALLRRRDEARPDPGAFERLRMRRIRRRRAQAATSATVALLLAVVAIWGITRAFMGHGSLPASRPIPIRPDNVSRLQLAWSVGSSGAAGVAPAVSGDEVYVTGFSLRAFPRSCGAEPCQPAWTGERAGEVDRTPVSDVAVGDNLVFATSSYVLGYPQDCAKRGASCKPTWVSSHSSIGFSSVLVADGIVYAQAHSGIWAFPEECSLSCHALWHAHLAAFGGELVSAGGGLVFAQDESVLKVFRSRCRSDGGPCHPLWEANVSSFGGRPVFSDGSVYVTRGLDEVVAFDVRCGRADECRPETVWNVPDAIGLAVSGRSLYVATNDSILAFDVDCPNARGCPAEWKTPVLPSPPSIPTVAEGLVFFTSGDTVFAMQDVCGSAGATCSPLLRERIPGASSIPLSQPTVTDRAVFVEGVGGAIYSLEVPAR
jgi:hypothetical protein